VSVLSSKARAVTHAERQAIASKILDGGDVLDGQGLFSLFNSYTSGDLTPEELRGEIVDYLNERIDVPIIDEHSEEEMIGGLVKGVELLLFDLAQDEYLPTIAEELITGELRPEDLEERLTEAVADRVDVPVLTDAMEEALLGHLVTIGRSFVLEMVRP
jgi:hypothetical protein